MHRPINSVVFIGGKNNEKQFLGKMCFYIQKVWGFLESLDAYNSKLLYNFVYMEAIFTFGYNAKVIHNFCIYGGDTPYLWGKYCSHIYRNYILALLLYMFKNQTTFSCWTIISYELM